MAQQLSWQGETILETSPAHQLLATSCQPPLCAHGRRLLYRCLSLCPSTGRFRGAGAPAAMQSQPAPPHIFSNL